MSGNSVAGEGVEHQYIVLTLDIPFQLQPRIPGYYPNFGLRMG
jgi:hypothetical protein